MATLHFQSLNAQNLENPTDKQLDTLVNKNTEDSLFVSYHLYDKVAEKIELSDSVISQRVLKYGSKNIDFSHTIHLGTDGSAGLNLTYKPIISSGIILGYDQYDIYSFRHQDLKIFDANIPLTLLRFSFLGGLQNFNIGTIFHTPLSDGQSITLDYNRYKLLGLYNQQAVLSTNFALYYQFNSKSNAYSATFGFIRNSNTEQNNGGILPNQDYTTPFKETLTTFLTEDSTKQIDQNVFLDHKLRFTKSSEDKVEFGMYHNFQYYKKYVKFVDHNVSDSISLSYFGNLITDTRGLRRLTDISTIGNSFWLYGELGKVKGKVGIYHGFSTITDQSNIINRHDLTLLFDGNLPIRKLFNIKTTAAFGIGGNAGNFDLKGEVSLFSGKNIQLDGFLQLFRSDISYQDKRLILNTTEQYSTSFENPFGSILNGKLSVSKINLNLHVTQTIINNAIYRQENFVPDQLTSIFSHTQFSLENEFKLWKLHFVNALHYQVVSHNIYPVPTFFSNHMLYFRGKWFRQALEAHFGAGMRYINDLPSFTYQPAVGTFVPISQSVAHDFPNVNVFFMGRASVFWFKFSMENILGYINDLPDFQLVNYPVYDPKFRFTIMWKLRD
ncbi:MAG: putative porin [Saprospiraceae bacterium]